MPATQTQASFARHLLPLFTTITLGSAASGVYAGKLGVYTSDEQGFNTHTFYYDDGQEVVVFDTQFLPALTQKMVDQIHQTTRSPITRVVVTHANPDKFNGLPVLHAAGARSISSQAIANDIPAVHSYKSHFWIDTMKAFKPSDYPRLENVQEAFTGNSTTLRLLSGETITLFALQHAGVASHQLVARIDATGDLIVGDLVHHRAHAWLEGGLQAQGPTLSIDKWMAALDELPALTAAHPQARVYGGRGEFPLVSEAVQDQKAYLQGAARITQAFMDEGDHCRLELQAGEAAQAQHAELETRISQAYPAYRLPYMVRYSIYGLAGSLARHSCKAERSTAQPPKVRVEHVFNQNADIVWNQLGRFCGITQWQSLVESCLVEERSDGFYRVVVMKDNTAYTERLERFSHPQRTFEYAIVNGPLPVTGYVSRFEIVPVDNDHARLIWQAWYDQPDKAPAEVAKQLSALYRNGITGMSILLAQAH